MLHGQRHGAGLQHLGALRGQLEHLLVGNFIKLAGRRNDARIGRIDALDIGVDVAAFGAKRCGQRDCRSVRAATPERRHAAVGAEPLKAGHHRDAAFGQHGLERGDLDGADARLGVRIIGLHRQLPAGPGARRDAGVLQRKRQETGGHLLAGREHHVVFAAVVDRHRLMRPGGQLVGHAGHRRDDDADLIARPDRRLDALRHGLDAVDVGERRAAELLDDSGHKLLFLAEIAVQRIRNRPAIRAQSPVAAQKARIHTLWRDANSTPPGKPMPRTPPS